MNWNEIVRFAFEWIGIAVLGWVSNSIATWRYTRRIQRGSFPSRAAHLLYGISKQLDKEGNDT